MGCILLLGTRYIDEASLMCDGRKCIFKSMKPLLDGQIESNFLCIYLKGSFKLRDIKI